MANTVIALKKSATPSAQPSALANGELAINFADGKLFYKHANGTILPFNTTGGNAYGTVNANGTLIVAGTSSDVFSLVAGNNITISGDAVNDRIIINSTGGASVNIGDTPPVTPTPVSGDLWWSSSQGTLLIYYNDGSSSQWVEAVSGSMYANVAEQIAIAGFNKANNALANSSTVFAGNLTITGNLTVSSNTVSVNGNNISPVQSFRNKIINGNFDFWQRGTSNTSVTSGQYLADRWFIGLAGTSGNISRQSFTLGQTSVPNEPTYFYRSIVTTSAGAGNYCLLGQNLESVRTLAGQTATLSFWAKADASKNIAIEFTQGFGSGGSPSSSVTAIGVTTCALTTSWQKFIITVNISSISGKTLGSNNNDLLGVNFWFDAGSSFNSRTNTLGQQSGTFDIAQVQLEVGSVATPFEMRPIETELALCQRYYWEGGNGSAGVQASSSTARFDVVFPTTMRAAPTITAIAAPQSTNPTVAETATGSQTTNFSGTAAGGLVTKQAASKIQFGGYSSFSDGRPTNLLNDCLSFSSEL